jgi:hypothetical protein
MLIVTVVRYSAIRETTDMGRLTIVLIQVGIVSFIGAATAFLSARLQKKTPEERAVNE